MRQTPDFHLEKSLCCSLLIFVYSCHLSPARVEPSERIKLCVTQQLPQPNAEKAISIPTRLTADCVWSQARSWSEPHAVTCSAGCVVCSCAVLQTKRAREMPSGQPEWGTLLKQFMSQLNAEALIQQRGISISKKGKSPAILFERVVRMPSGKEEIVWTAKWQMKLVWTPQRAQSEAWTQKIIWLWKRGELILEERWSEGNTRKTGTGDSCQLPPVKLCIPSEMPWGCPTRWTWQCHAQCLESWMNLSGLGTDGYLPNAAPWLPIEFHPLPILYTFVTVLPVLDPMNKWLYLPFISTWSKLSVISGNRITSLSFLRDTTNL